MSFSTFQTHVKINNISLIKPLLWHYAPFFDSNDNQRFKVEIQMGSWRHVIFRETIFIYLETVSSKFLGPTSQLGITN